MLVTSFDDGFLGALFLSFLGSLTPGVSYVTNNGALPSTVPGLQFVSNTTNTPASLRAAVANSDAWGAIYLSSGSTARLQAALASPTAAAAFDASLAVSVIWDDARNNAVSAPRIGGPLKGLAEKFNAVAAKAVTTQWIKEGASSAAFSSSPAALAAVLASPASYSEVSLFPFTLPAYNVAVVVGQILMCVFGLVTTNVVFGPLSAHPFVASAAPGIARSLRLYALVIMLSCTIGAAFATILIGLAQTNNLGLLNKNLVSGVTYGATAASSFSGSVWAQLWACQWIEASIFALWLCIPAQLNMLPAAAALLAPLIIYNSLSVNTDLSDVGYQFFYYAPMWHSNEIMRNILFGTLSSRLSMQCVLRRDPCCSEARARRCVRAKLTAYIPALSPFLPRSIGIHWLWFLVETISFFAAGAIGAKRKAAAEAAASAAKAAPAPADDKADVAVAVPAA